MISLSLKKVIKKHSLKKDDTIIEGDFKNLYIYHIHPRNSKR